MNRQEPRYRYRAAGAVSLSLWSFICHFSPQLRLSKGRFSGPCWAAIYRAMKWVPQNRTGLIMGTQVITITDFVMVITHLPNHIMGGLIRPIQRSMNISLPPEFCTHCFVESLSTLA